MIENFASHIIRHLFYSHFGRLENKAPFRIRVIQEYWPATGREPVSKIKVQGTVWARSGMVDQEHDSLTIKDQCRLLGISRSGYYYKPHNANEDWEIEMLKAILEELTKRPFYGYRKNNKGFAGGKGHRHYEKTG